MKKKKNPLSKRKCDLYHKTMSNMNIVFSNRLPMRYVSAIFYHGPMDDIIGRKSDHVSAS